MCIIVLKASGLPDEGGGHTPGDNTASTFILYAKHITKTNILILIQMGPSYQPRVTRQYEVSPYDYMRPFTPLSRAATSLFRT